MIDFSLEFLMYKNMCVWTCSRWPSRINCVAVLPVLGGPESPVVFLGADDGVLRLVGIAKEGPRLLMAIKTHTCSIVQLASDPTGDAKSKLVLAASNKRAEAQTLIPLVSAENHASHGDSCLRWPASLFLLQELQ